MEDITDATAPMDGLEVIANKLLIGVRVPHVKTTQDVLNKALRSIATVPEDGPENFVTFNKFLVRLLLRIEV